MDSRKIKTILYWVTPTSIRDVQCFLGFASREVIYTRVVPMDHAPYFMLDERGHPQSALHEIASHVWGEKGDYAYFIQSAVAMYNVGRRLLEIPGYLPLEDCHKWVLGYPDTSSPEDEAGMKRVSGLQWSQESYKHVLQYYQNCKQILYEAGNQVLFIISGRATHQDLDARLIHCVPGRPLQDSRSSALPRPQTPTNSTSFRAATAKSGCISRAMEVMGEYKWTIEKIDDVMDFGRQAAKRRITNLEIEDVNNTESQVNCPTEQALSHLPSKAPLIKDPSVLSTLIPPEPFTTKSECLLVLGTILKQTSTSPGLCESGPS
ncbi:hypothetical protein BDK51DRAFT_51372 [Blyttiomyces helicus]|uniref:Uncharacterized protein n=1 Tax=Blyttiomyces helicus TaxID=388810 RepID=A0A4P9WG72_9FUNG|nr:hypothetical protein BDK51DRAFT_51372 [Blyttiomyces helicus]|eukprot:RKO91801.1 hypothetical protein BDK51DRAFT_51372 [Blyttiomyces helicus]